MISGAVAGVDFRNTGGADPFGEGKDLRVGLIVEVEAADQGFYFFIRESRGDLTDNGIGAAVGTAVEDHKTVRCVEDKTLLMGEGIRSPAPSHGEKSPETSLIRSGYFFNMPFGIPMYFL